LNKQQSVTEGSEHSRGTLMLDTLWRMIVSRHPRFRCWLKSWRCSSVTTDNDDDYILYKRRFSYRLKPNYHYYEKCIIFSNSILSTIR